MNTRSPTLSLFLPPLVFVAAVALYLSTLAPGMLRGDSGEFQWAMASLNVAHATGYPLFTLLGFAWLQLPLAGAAAWRLNLLSAIFGALAVATVFVFARALTRRSDAALIAAIFFALAPVFWFNASLLEVYTLNAFFLALILFLLWRWSVNPRASAPLYLAFFVLGLALAHHRLVVLALPGILIFLLLTNWRILFSWRIFLLAFLLLPGLLLYLYVPLRLLAAGATLHYAIYDIMLGQEFSNSLLREFHLLEVLAQIPFENFHAGLALALLGAVTLFRRKRNLALALALVYVMDAAFALVYSVPDVQVFLTPSFVVIALWTAVGAGFVIEWTSAHFPRGESRVAAIAAPVLLLLLALVSVTRYDQVRAQVNEEAGTAETRARTLLTSNLRSGALLEIDWETATAIRFLQATERLRLDLEARLIKLSSREEYLWALQNVDAGRAVYTEREVKWTRALAGYGVQPGPADLAQITRVPIQAEIVEGKIDDRVQLTAMHRDDSALVLYWQVRQPLTRDLATFVHYFDVDGIALGQEDRAACCEALYGYRTSEWERGREIADSFHPPPQGANYLRTGMYSAENGEIEAYGRTLFFQIRPVTIPASARWLNAEFGAQFIARAYDLSKEGDHWKLVVYWEMRGVPKADYKIFAHLLDGAGKILAQTDREPLDGIYPTSAWRTGQIVRDPYQLPARADGAKIEIGMYYPPTGERLARSDGKGDAGSIDLR